MSIDSLNSVISIISNSTVVLYTNIWWAYFIRMRLTQSDRHLKEKMAKHAYILAWLITPFYFMYLQYYKDSDMGGFINDKTYNLK